MTLRSIKISADIPSGVSDAQVAEYVAVALGSWGGGSNPDEDPLFESLKVKWVSLAGTRYGEKKQ